MPEFESFLTFAQRLRLAVSVQRPYAIGRLMAEVANDRRYDRTEILRLYRLVEEAVEERYGDGGRDQFRRAFDRFVR